MTVFPPQTKHPTMPLSHGLPKTYMALVSGHFQIMSRYASATTASLAIEIFPYHGLPSSIIPFPRMKSQLSFMSGIFIRVSFPNALTILITK
jgi:hypothetical protein